MSEPEKNGAVVAARKDHHHRHHHNNNSNNNNSSSDAAAADPEEGEGWKGRCKWGPLSPQWCQTFRRPVWMLVCLCWASTTQGMAVNGLVNVVISTVERRFYLSSTESGLIASCYDIAFVLCIVPVSYFGGRGRKPVYIAVGMFFLGVGSFVLTLPHFATGLYEASQGRDSLCSGGDSEESVCGSREVQLSSYRFLFYLGQLLHGVGAISMFILGTIYLDSNLPVASTALYHGIFYAFGTVGPGIGYLAGGALLDIYTDFDKVDPSQVSMKPDNPRWVGAWWLGFLITGTMALMICLPLFGFPKSLPGAEKYRAEKEKEVYRGKDDKHKGCEEQSLGFRHILTYVRCLVTNPTFMFLSLSVASEGIVVMGLSTFAPKYIEYQFSITSGTAAQYVGMVSIPMAGGFTFFGGWLVKRFRWTIPQILKFCVAFTLLAEACLLVFLIHCPSLPFAGISTPYRQPVTTVHYLGSAQLDASCNAGCGCSMLDYNPVCGRDNVMYYSPCYAGCSSSFAADAKKHSNCSCVMYNYTADDINKDSSLWMVEEGGCDSDCPYLIVFLVVFGLLMVGVFITTMPALTASLRSVTQDQRTFALGIQSIVGRCLGSIPGPIITGKVIDMACLVWQPSCDGDGSCLYYDNRAMGYNIMALMLCANCLTAVFFALALFFYRSGPTPSLQQVSPSARVDGGPPGQHEMTTALGEPSTSGHG